MARFSLERVLSRPSCCLESEAITEGRGSLEGMGWAQAVRKNLDPDTGGQHPVMTRTPAQPFECGRCKRSTNHEFLAFLLLVGGSQAARSGQ